MPVTRAMDTRRSMPVGLLVVIGLLLGAVIGLVLDPSLLDPSLLRPAPTPVATTRPPGVATPAPPSAVSVPTPPEAMADSPQVRYGDRPGGARPPLVPETRMLHGLPRIIDGDTIVVSGVHVRLRGLDAEEMNERNGPAARKAMQDIARGPVTCALNGEKSYNRLVGTCNDADGRDIAAELVRRGFALDCARFSGGLYRSLEPPGARSNLVQKPYC